MAAERATRALLLYAASETNETLSYQRGWPRHFQSHPRFDCTALNVRDRRAVRAFMLRSIARPRFDLVVLLHSIFSNARELSGRLAGRVAGLDAPKAFFIGNEYKLMPEKMAFCEELGIDLLVSQITSEPTLELYRERLGCKVVGIPNTGLDTSLFAPRASDLERPVDLGYRAYDSPWYLGHRERWELVERVSEAGRLHGLRLDLSLDPADRLNEREWAAFLNGCKGQIGTEAGGDYFELTDETRENVNAYLTERVDARFDEVHERFFAQYTRPVSGRALSGRIVEAAGTKTAQLLLEGEYGGYFEPHAHYIPISKDFSDLEEALALFTDSERRRQIAEAAYEVAVSELTYERLIDRFYEALPL